MSERNAEIERLMDRVNDLRAIEIELRAEVVNCHSLASAVIERLTTDRDELLATVERVRALADEWTRDYETRAMTHDDRDDRADARDAVASDVREALRKP